jgi:hypothetical protein
MSFLWSIPLVGERLGFLGIPILPFGSPLVGSMLKTFDQISLMKHLYLYFELSTPIKVNM